jgi:Na+-translocating ferredoxin:NAD+ oxidoreductase subunit B
MPINVVNTPLDTKGGLAQRLNAVLPQTQCQRCGFDGCLPYAIAMAQKETKPNRCPPGGANGLKALSEILGNPENFELTLDLSCGDVGPRTAAYIREDLCIGCTKCIDVCPTDAIVGAPKKLHFVITEFCTGCDLCLPPCPVDCITMTAIDDGKMFSWEQWSADESQRAKKRFENKQARLNAVSKTANQQNKTQEINMPAGDALGHAVSNAIGTALERAKAKAKQRLANAATQAKK